ncbi:hypothetical protein [Inquilinus limosus]|uniref:hypothetical protein n=1 Tax=Inquilinus limosus TaxID=171674 RepID=UPI0012DD1595|nr:hypothetical protein [Inquilinus limosus]
MKLSCGLVIGIVLASASALAQTQPQPQTPATGSCADRQQIGCTDTFSGESSNTGASGTAPPGKPGENQGQPAPNQRPDRDRQPPPKPQAPNPAPGGTGGTGDSNGG